MSQKKTNQSTNRVQSSSKEKMAYLLLLSTLAAIGIIYFLHYKKSLPFEVKATSTQMVLNKDLAKKEVGSGYPEGLDKRVVIDAKALEEYLKTPLVDLPSQEEIALHYTLLFMYCNKVMGTYNLQKAQAMKRILCHYKKYGMTEGKFLEAIDKGSIPGKFRRMPQESMHKHRRVYQADFDIEALIRIMGE